jgi:hypothetical protein
VPGLYVFRTNNTKEEINLMCLAGAKATSRYQKILIYIFLVTQIYNSPPDLHNIFDPWVGGYLGRTYCHHLLP